MKRRVVEDILVPAVIVAAPPATVSQRNCLECFGLSRADYLRLVAKGAFPVREEGKLRIAKYADVEAYLTTGSRRRPGPGPAGPSPAPKKRTIDDVDVLGTLYKAGFRRQ